MVIVFQYGMFTPILGFVTPILHINSDNGPLGRSPKNTQIYYLPETKMQENF